MKESRYRAALKGAGRRIISIFTALHTRREKERQTPRSEKARDGLSFAVRVSTARLWPLRGPGRVEQDVQAAVERVSLVLYLAPAVVTIHPRALDLISSVLGVMVLRSSRGRLVPSSHQKVTTGSFGLSEGSRYRMPRYPFAHDRFSRGVLVICVR